MQLSTFLPILSLALFASGLPTPTQTITAITTYAAPQLNPNVTAINSTRITVPTSITPTSTPYNHFATIVSEALAHLNRSVPAHNATVTHQRPIPIPSFTAGNRAPIPPFHGPHRPTPPGVYHGQPTNYNGTHQVLNATATASATHRNSKWIVDPSDPAQMAQLFGPHPHNSGEIGQSGPKKPVNIPRAVNATLADSTPTTTMSLGRISSPVTIRLTNETTTHSILSTITARPTPLGPVPIAWPNGLPPFPVINDGAPRPSSLHFHSLLPTHTLHRHYNLTNDTDGTLGGRVKYTHDYIYFIDPATNETLSTITRDPTHLPSKGPDPGPGFPFPPRHRTHHINNTNTSTKTSTKTPTTLLTHTHTITTPPTLSTPTSPIDAPMEPIPLPHIYNAPGPVLPPLHQNQNQNHQNAKPKPTHQCQTHLTVAPPPNIGPKKIIYAHYITETISVDCKGCKLHVRTDHHGAHYMATVKLHTTGTKTKYACEQTGFWEDGKERE